MSATTHDSHRNIDATQQQLDGLRIDQSGTPRASGQANAPSTPPTTGHVDLAVLAATPTSHPSNGAAHRDMTLPVIDPDGALEQCCDWAFIVELLGDVMNDRQTIVDDMQSAIDTNDHVKYYKTAHALKGAALNLHLPALVDVSKAAELLGKELEKQPNDERMVSARQGYVDALNVEYDRLQAYLPEAEANAAAEGGGEDEYED